MFKMFSRPEFPYHILQTSDLADDMVLRFQQVLNRKGSKYGIQVQETGVYDVQTRFAVSSYQLRALGIVNSDGFVGPQTARKLRIKLVEDPS